MLNAVAKLLISALVSVHQYIPNDSPTYEKYFNDVRDINEENILPAAHQSCRYLISVFVTAGLDSTLGGDHQGSALSNTLANLLGGDQTFKWAMGLFDDPKYKSQLERYEIDPNELKKVLSTLCQEEYKPFAFTPAQRKEVVDFIKSEIHVLSDSQIQSLGAYKYFGSVDLLDRHGMQIGTIDAIPRVWVPYHQIPKSVILALLVTEDDDFFTHKGVDTKAIARIVKQILSDSQATGGSTITMQLLKNLYFKDGPQSVNYPMLNSGQPSTILRKVREWYWAWPYEDAHTLVDGDLKAKEYILEMYFNLMDFGPRIQGIGQAAYTYFKKDAKDLSVAESAFIATLLKAPSRYSNPTNYVEYTYPRRNDYVLTRMKTLGAITEEEFQQAVKTELPVWNLPTSIAVDNPSIYIRDHAKEWLGSYDFEKHVQAKEIVVESTVDKNLQEIVYSVVKENLDKQDEVRNKLNAIGPARDDRGRTARFREEDFGTTVTTRLNRLDLLLKKSSSSEYMITMYLGKADKSSLFYYHTDDFFNPEKKLEKQINALLKNQGSIPGDILLVRNTNDKLDIVNHVGISEFADQSKLLSNETPESVADSILSLLQELQSLKPSMYRNSLNRLEWAKPRADMLPAIYIQQKGGLLHKDDFQIQLTDSHKKHFDSKVRSKEFEDGQIFWVKDKDGPVVVEEPNQDIEDEDSEVPAPTVVAKDPKSIIYELDTPKLQAAVLIMNSQTGEVLANFGGYDPSTSSFDRSRFARRQAGSTLKPWVYFYALNKGFNPQNVLNNRSVTFQIDKNKYYRPKNYSGGVGADLSIAKALTQSQNIAALSLIQHPIWGPDWKQNLNELRDFLKLVDLYESPIDSPTIILGAQELSVAKLVSSFSFFSNGKHIVKPQYFKYLSDSKGNVIYRGDIETVEVPTFKPNSIFQIQTMLIETANSGTASSLRSFISNLNKKKYQSTCFNDLLGSGKQSCFGGKTGTSNDSRDTWFIGFSKNFVVGVWVGYDYPRPIGGSATGGSMALPIFRGIIEKGETYLPPIEPIVSLNDVPAGIERRTVYGNTACPSGEAKDAYVIFSDRSSSQNSCSTYRPRTLAQCECRRVLYSGNDFDYHLDVTYMGELYQSFMKFETEGTENDRVACEQALLAVKNSEGQLVCVPQ
ncbi:MAG: transglycosylase domain-containing protein [Bdellovibrionaceae bacterium]|nr:transglycosylase domain-containing protein [Pseudobdellovibrionaceae bacterium]